MGPMFNSSLAQDLAGAIKNTHEEIAEKVKMLWTQMSAQLQSEWVGEDESNAEGELAEEVKRLFITVGKSINRAQNFVKMVNDIKVDAVNARRLTGGQGIATSIADTKFEIVPVDETAALIEGVVKDPALKFGAEVSRGLVSPDSPATLLSTMDTFSNSLREETSAIFGKIDATLAFIGQGQGEAMQDLIGAFGKALGSVLDSCSNIKDAIRNLAQTVNEEAQATQAEISKMSSEAEGLTGIPANLPNGPTVIPPEMLQPIADPAIFK